MRRTLTRALGGLLIATAVGRPLGAQARSTVDVGFSVVQFPEESTTVAGPSVGWLSSVEWRRLFGRLSAEGVGTVGAATGSVSLTGGARAPFLRGWLVEGAGELSGVAGSSARSAATVGASGRILRVVGQGGGWARGTTSMSRREAGNLPGRSGELGAWWSWPGGRVSASLLEQHARGQLFTGPFRERLVGTIPVQYAEGLMGVRLEGDDRSLELTLGARRDPDAVRLIEPVFSATAAFWQSETRAWTISFSRTPPDFVRGADAARGLTVGIRFNEPRPVRARAARIRPIVQVSGTGTDRVVRVRAPGAKQIELMADFTEWAPVSMTPSLEGFARAVTLAPGSHRILVRVDGGPWRTAANTPAVDDDLGGRVGLLVVP
ncbi:MAG: glycogen-binding domain-containing protein [Gemmatimonadaceae bacterium]